MFIHPSFPEPCLVFNHGTFFESLVFGLLLLKLLLASAGVRTTSLQDRRPRNPINSFAFYSSLQHFAFCSHSNLLVSLLDCFGVYAWGPGASCYGGACFTGFVVQQYRP